MRTIIAGSRMGVEYKDVLEAIKQSGFESLISVVISGTAAGADGYGETWAGDSDIPVERYPADWNTYGKSAGPIRNKLMADNAEALIAVWDGESRGTKHMISVARKVGLKVYVHIVGRGSLSDYD